MMALSVALRVRLRIAVGGSASGRLCRRLNPLDGGPVPRDRSRHPLRASAVVRAAVRRARPARHRLWRDSADSQLRPDCAAPAPVVLSRVAMSGFLRDPEHRIFYAQALLAHWRPPARVLNGADVLAIDSSKARQLSLIAGLGLAIPGTRVVHRARGHVAAAADDGLPACCSRPMSAAPAPGSSRYDSASALADAVASASCPTASTRCCCVQDYVPARGGTIIRVETLGGNFLYAIEVESGGAASISARPTPASPRPAAQAIRMAR